METSTFLHIAAIVIRVLTEAPHLYAEMERFWLAVTNPSEPPAIVAAAIQTAITVARTTAEVNRADIARHVALEPHAR